MGVELVVHLGNVAVICETEIGIVADDQMFVNGNAHDSAGMN